MFARPFLIWLPVALVASLLLLNIFFTYFNQRIIIYNHTLQTKAEKIRSNVSEILWGTIHGVDIGLRGYAIVPEDRFFEPMKIALADKDSLFSQLEQDLQQQEFDMQRFYQLRDSIEAYIALTRLMKHHLDQGNHAEFIALYSPDKGEKLFRQYDKFRLQIEAFEQQITAEADERYQTAISNQYMVQLALLLLCVPTLLLTVHYFYKSLKVSNELAEANAAKANMVRKQKESLEKKVEDRTEALRMQMNIIRGQHTELQAINDSKDKIFSALSHDLRGPLANLQSTLAALRHGILNGDESVFILDKLETSFQRTNDLLNDLLMWSKSQMSGLSIQKKKFSLTESLNSLIDFYRENGEEKRILIENKTEDEIQVKAGKEMIELVLRNLLSNAIKFTPEGGKIEVEAFKDNGKACVKIADTGIGMTDTAIYNVLNKGITVSTPGTNMEKGTGMGLLLVKEFIKLHRGHFKVDSDRGKGTTFFFSIPRK